MSFGRGVFRFSPRENGHRRFGIIHRQDNPEQGTGSNEGTSQE